MLSRLSGLLKREGTGWLFRQALVRDTAYEGLPYRQRARLHGKLADLLAADGHQLDSAALSLHYFEAGRYGEAMRHAEAAATSAKDAYACFDAAFLLERALAAARRLSDVATEQHAALQEQLGDVRHRLGEFSRADVNFTAASRLRRDDPVGRARVTVAAARSAERRGEYGLALRRLARAWRTLSGEPDEERVEQLRARIRLQTGWLRFHQEKPAEAKAACQPLVESADPPPPEVLASALQLTDLAELAMGESQGGRLERAMSLYGQLGDLWAQANLYGQLGYRAYFEGRWPEALRHYQRSQELCERAGDTWYASVQTGNIAEILLDQGKLTEAESALRQALPVWRASGAGEQIAFGTALLGRAQCRRGHFEEGRALLNRALEQYRKDGSVGDARDVEAYLAESFMLEGRLDEALTAARALLAATESSARAPLLHRIIGRCLEAQGDSTAALASYQKGLQLARQRGAQHEVAFLLTALGASGTGQRQPLEEARQLYAELGVVVDLTVPAPRRRTPAQIAPSG
jgi:tetratricopeptide (TPR) repeat protein